MAERERPQSDHLREGDPWESAQPESPPQSSPECSQFARLEQEVARLQVEVDHLRGDLADFEGRYQMSLEEFRARLSPDAETSLQEDCWDWARCAEQCRQLCLELERIRDRLTAGKFQAAFHKPTEREHKAELQAEPRQPIPTSRAHPMSGLLGPGAKRRRT